MRIAPKLGGFNSPIKTEITLGLVYNLAYHLNHQSLVSTLFLFYLEYFILKLIHISLSLIQVDYLFTTTSIILFNTLTSI